MKQIASAFWDELNKPVSGLAFWVATLGFWAAIGNDIHEWWTWTRPMNACNEQAEHLGMAVCTINGLSVTISKRDK